MNILITGASRGIGAATFEPLRSTGHTRRRPLDRRRRRTDRRRLHRSRSPARMWDAALERLGHIDVLVNNAGIYEGVADDASDEEWHAAWARTLTVNLQAAADLSRLAIAHFRDRGGGRIVNVSSRAAYRGDSPEPLALCRVQGGDARHDQDHRPRLCARRHPRLRGLPRLHHDRHGRGISGRPRRRDRSSPKSRSAASPAPTKSPKPSAGWPSTRRPPRPAR